MFRLVLFITGLFVLAGCRPAAAPVSVGNKAVSVNGVRAIDAQMQPTKPVPEMSWTGFEGTVGKIKDLNGKVVILDFWATYCPPCIEEIPHLMELQAKYGAENLHIVGLHVGGEEDRPKVPAFVERLQITYPLAYPEDALTAYIFGQQTAIPQTAIFDRNGRLVKKIAGFDASIKAELDEAVASAIAKNE
ncbi:MAG TPA: TlpA disulfide reductase family protein [Pyrinomonadaceae bacterium]